MDLRIELIRWNSNLFAHNECNLDKFEMSKDTQITTKMLRQSISMNMIKMTQELIIENIKNCRKPRTWSKLSKFSVTVFCFRKRSPQASVIMEFDDMCKLWYMVMILITQNIKSWCSICLISCIFLNFSFEFLVNSAVCLWWMFSSNSYDTVNSTKFSEYST